VTVLSVGGEVGCCEVAVQGHNFYDIVYAVNFLGDDFGADFNGGLDGIGENEVSHFVYGYGNSDGGNRFKAEGLGVGRISRGKDGTEEGYFFHGGFF
jgi:hypothetical protein